MFKFMTQSITVWAFYVFAVFANFSLHSQASSILKYNGLNFSK